MQNLGLYLFKCNFSLSSVKVCGVVGVGGYIWLGRGFDKLACHLKQCRCHLSQKRGFSKKNIISWDLLNIIYDGNIGETSKVDLKGRGQKLAFSLKWLYQILQK